MSKFNFSFQFNYRKRDGSRNISEDVLGVQLLRVSHVFTQQSTSHTHTESQLDSLKIFAGELSACLIGLFITDITSAKIIGAANVEESRCCVFIQVK